MIVEIGIFLEQVCNRLPNGKYRKRIYWWTMCNRLPSGDKMTTIRDVAKLAGVSEATVSRVLNNKGYVSQETLKKVKEAIQKLNYRPNEVARMLYNKRSNIIGLMLPDITNPFFPELARAVEDVATTLGYTVILCNTDSDSEKEKNYIDVLSQKYVDGLIVMSHSLESIDYKKLPFPIVSLDRILDQSLPFVTAQNREGARIATEYLIKTGSQSIFHIRGPKYVTTAEERYLGYAEVMRENNLTIQIEECEYDLHKAYQLALSLLNKMSEVDAIFAGNDLIAAGVLKAAQEMGFDVPNDLQIIGFDGIDVGKYTRPEITTISQPIYQMGAIAAELLVAEIQGKKDKEINSFLPVKLEVRGTTK